MSYQLSRFLFGFYPCEILELVCISIPNSSSSKTDFIWIFCGVFDVGGFTGSSLIERSNSPLVLSPHMMDYDVYMHDLVVLVVTFGTSPRS